MPLYGEEVRSIVKLKRVTIDQVSERTLILNLYSTQAIIFIVAWALLWWQNRFTWELWHFESASVWLWGIGMGMVVVVVDLTLSRLFPQFMVDNSGLNEKLFRNRAVWHIFLMAAVVALCEELLFRGALQPLIGIFWTSVIFTFIHFRYLAQWMMIVVVFFISLGLGGLLQITGSLIAPVVAHFVIDFTLGVLLRFGFLEHFISE